MTHVLVFDRLQLRAVDCSLGLWSIVKWGRGKRHHPDVPVPPPPDGLNEAARKVYEERVRKFANDLYDEAGRLEAAQNPASESLEITSTMITDADIQIRRAYRRGRGGAMVLVASVGANAFALLVGVALTAIDKGWGQTLFVVGVAGAVILNAVAVTRER